MGLRDKHTNSLLSYSLILQINITNIAKKKKKTSTSQMDFECNYFKMSLEVTIKGTFKLRVCDMQQ